MAKRGPAPKPAIIQMIHGDPGKRAKRMLDKQFKPPAGNLQCPDWATPDARAEWDRVIDELGGKEYGGQRLLTGIDMAILAAYCEAVSDLKRATEKLAKHGDTYPIKDKDGNITYLQQTPWVGQKNRAMAAVRQLSSEIGFTPSSRNGLEARDSNMKTDAEVDFGF